MPRMPSEPVNGTQVESDGDSARPSSLAERDAAIKAAFLAAGEDEVAEAGRPTAAQGKKKPAPAPEPDEDDDGDGGEDADEDLELEDEVEEIEHEETEVEDDEVEDDEAAAGKDPELGKRLAIVQKRERRMREQLATREREFEQRHNQFVAEWKPKVEAAEAFEKQKARAAHDPIAMAELFGFTEDDYEDLSKIFHGHSKAAAADPKWKDFARRLQKDRETSRKLSDLETSNKSLQERLDRDREAGEQSQRRDQYLSRTAKLASDKTPLAQKDLARDPNGTREKLRILALKVAEKTGAAPEPKKLIALYEKRRRAGLERDGELYEFLKASPAAAAKGGKTAAGKKPAIAVEDRTAAGKPAKGGSLLPTRDQMMRGLDKIAKGDLDPDLD